MDVLESGFIFVEIVHMTEFLPVASAIQVSGQYSTTIGGVVRRMECRKEFVSRTAIVISQVTGQASETLVTVL